MKELSLVLFSASFSATHLPPSPSFYLYLPPLSLSLSASCSVCYLPFLTLTSGLFFQGTVLGACLESWGERNVPLGLSVPQGPSEGRGSRGEVEGMTGAQGQGSARMLY